MASELAAAFITSSLILSAVTVMVMAKSFMSSLVDGKEAGLPLLSSLLQHAGILLAVISFTWRSPAGIIVAAILIVAHLTFSRTRSSLPPEIEAIVVATALLGLGSIAIIRGAPFI